MHQAKLGVIIVTYNAANTIRACLESLLPCPAERMRIVVVDNCSTDATRDLVEEISEQSGRVAIVPCSVNTGFAAGVNVGLSALSDDPEVTHFWLLNPDCTVSESAIAHLLHFLDAGHGQGLTGGRVTYTRSFDCIQTDGGQINRKTGVTRGLHRGLSAKRCPSPNTALINFISGANLVASRAFVRDVGPMHEGFFLYYEEVEWALRGSNYPLDYCSGFEVLHDAGASIGSGTPNRPASPFSMYFLHRSRMQFLREIGWGAGPAAYGFGLAKACQLAIRGSRESAIEVLRGTFGMKPSTRVKARLSNDTQMLLQNLSYSVSTPSRSRKAVPSASQTTR